MERIKVIELFAGVGGFRLGLERVSDVFKFVWSNQWEPSTKKQDASFIYTRQFGEEGHSNEDIAKVPTKDIPGHDMLVAGFPCQDYSVAKTLNQAAGIIGKKGVLWWEIHRIIREKKTKYLLLENVDRLLKSPAKQRGRDFAIILASLADLGYIVEWRVINAADYGMPQRRRRVYFFAYLDSSGIGGSIKKNKTPIGWVLKDGVMAKAFKVENLKLSNNEPNFTIEGDLSEITKDFNKGRSSTPFENTGIMIKRKVWTIKTSPKRTGKSTTLGDILIDDRKVPREYFVNDDMIDKWKYLKGAKDEKRVHKLTGIPYEYNEGPMAFPDPLDKPSRTIVTGEGGAAPSRFKHVVRTDSGKLRRLTPIELERLNMFPDDHTHGVSDIKRAFIMGNALVVGVVSKLGEKFIDSLGQSKGRNNGFRRKTI